MQELTSLTQTKIIEVMREEWGRKILHLEKAVKTFLKTPEGEKFILGTGTKVKHSGSGLLYTITAVDKGKNILILRAPDGAEFPVDGEEFSGDSPEYVVD